MYLTVFRYYAQGNKGMILLMCLMEFYLIINYLSAVSVAFLRFLSNFIAVFLPTLFPIDDHNAALIKEVVALQKGQGCSREGVGRNDGLLE